MIKKIFSLKSIVLSRLLILSVVFLFFICITLIITNSILGGAKAKLINHTKTITTNLIEEKIKSETYEIVDTFYMISQIAHNNNILDAVKNFSNLNNTKINLYKSTKGAYILEFSSGEKPSNLIDYNSEISIAVSAGGNKIYKSIDNNYMYINGYFGYFDNDNKYIVQIVRKVPLEIKNLNILHIENDKNFKFVNFDNEEVSIKELSSIDTSDYFFIPSTKQYIDAKFVSDEFSLKNVYISIFIGLFIIFLIWLFTEIVYYKLSTKPIIEITGSLENALIDLREVNFKEQFIEEYKKISDTAKKVFNNILSQQIKFETLIERLPIPVAIIDNKFKFIYKNSGFNLIFSLPEDISDQSFLDIIPNTLKTLETGLISFVNSPKQREKFELYDPKRDEYYLVRFAKIFDKDNSLSEIIILFNDISYQKQETEKQKRRKEEIERILLTIEESVFQLSSSSSDLKTSVESLNTMLAEQNTSFSETNVAIQELTSSSKSIFTKAKHISEVSDKVDKASQLGFNQVESSYKKINNVIGITDKLTNTIFELNKKTNNIDKILKTIYEISEQTNLLALNASIEAVRGDTNNKSFKIIAEEIRDLSDKTSSFSKEIEKEIEDISNVGSTSVMIVEEAEKILKDTYEHLQENKSTFEVIRTEADHINKHLKEIIKVIEDLDTAVNDISSNSNDIMVAMKDALSSAKESKQSILDIDNVIKNLNEILTHLTKLK
jgi:methyl-accepting chemotaxis protein